MGDVSTSAVALASHSAGIEMDKGGSMVISKDQIELAVKNIVLFKKEDRGRSLTIIKDWVSNSDTEVHHMEQILRTYKLVEILSVYIQDQKIKQNGSNGDDGSVISVDDQILAAWCLTNITYVSHEFANEVLRLCGDNLFYIISETMAAISTGDVRLQEQVAWTIGNLAGDSQEIRDAMIHSQENKCLQVLGHAIKIFVSFVDNNVLLTMSDTAKEYLRNLIWTVSNLLRGSKTSSLPFSSLGIHQDTCKLLWFYEKNQINNDTKSIDLQIISELCWITSFLSAKEIETCQQLIQMDLFRVICSIYFQTSSLLSKVPAASLEDEPASRMCKIAFPCLRTIGNLLIELNETSFVQQNITIDMSLLIDAVLPGIQATLNQKFVKAYSMLAAEACWICGKVFSISSNDANVSQQMNKIFTVYAEKTCKPLTSIVASASLMSSAVVHEAKKESFLALMSLLRKPSTSTKKSYISEILDSSPNIIPNIIGTLKTSSVVLDIDMIRAILDFLDIIMKEIPNKAGIKAVEMNEGIDAIESIQYNQSCPKELNEYAANLVDKYFGHDENGDDDDNAFEQQQQIPSVGRGRGLLLPSWMANKQ